MLAGMDWTVIVIYFAALALLSFLASRTVKTSSDYHLGGRRFGLLLVLGTMVGTTIGGAATMGRSGVAYTDGISIIWAIVSFSIGYILFTIILLPKIRKLEDNIWTINELLRTRFGKPTGYMSALFLMAGVLTIFGTQVMAFAILLNMIGSGIGITFTMAVLIGGVFIVLYTFMGGFVTVVWTDFMQVVIMFFVMLLLTITVFSQANVSAIVSQIPARNLDLFHGVNIWVAIGWFITFFIAPIGDATLWQRVMAARSTKIAAKSAILNALAFLIWGLVVVALGLFAIVLVPNLVETYGTADSAIIALMHKYFPKGLLGLGIAALFAAIVSTANSCLQLASMMLNRDVLLVAKPDLTDRQIVRYSRIATLAFGVFGVVIAMFASGLFNLMYLGYAFTIASAVIPILCALFWPKVNGKVILFGMIASSIVIIVLYAAGKPWGIEPVVPGLVVSGLTILVGNLIFKNRDELKGNL